MALRCVLLAIALFAGCKSQQVAKPPTPTVDGSRLWPVRDVSGYDPHRVIALSVAPELGWDGNDYGSEHYRDIMSHTPAKSRWSKPDASPTTIAHETHHGLQAHQSNAAGGDVRFFYFERGYGALVPRPEQTLRLLRKEAGTNVYTEDARTDTRRVRDYIPAAAKRLAKLRYELYLIDPERERYGVLVLLNEWNAYIASARIAIEMWDAGEYYEESKPGGPRGETVRQIGELDGMVDFMYFSAAGIAALADNEPDYLKGNPQLRAVFAVFAEQTMHWLNRGRTIPLFSGFHADELREQFAHSPDNAAIRRVLKGWLGAEWTERVLGF